MIINCCKKQKGYTLLELMLAMALFVSLAGGLGYAIIRGVDAHAFESSYREATLQTRTVLDQMLEEMRTAVVPEESNALSSNQASIPSAVWFPDAYGSKSNVFGNTFYKQELKKSTNSSRSQEIHVAHNRLIFTRKNPEDTSSYVFVDWFVPSNRRNRIYRVVHQFSNLGDVPYQYSSSKYSFKNAASYFGNGVGVGKNLLFSSDKQSDYVVSQLPGGADRFCFAVEHEPNESVYNGINSGAVADRNGAKYNPKLFRVRIKATVYDKGETSYMEDSSNKMYEASDIDPYTTAVKKGNSYKRVVVYNEQAYTEH